MSRNYALGKKVKLNSKYIKITHYKKLEKKFFGSFQILHTVGKQAYKLELPIKWKIYDLFHVSLLKQDIKRKKQVDNQALPKPEKEFEAKNNKEYKIKAIINSAVYGKEVNNQIPDLYYLVSWKSYLNEENTWEPSMVIKHLRKLINIFHKKYLKKPIITSLFLAFAPLIVRPTVSKEQPK